MTGAGQCACEWSGHALKVVCITHLEAVREFDGMASKPPTAFRVFCPEHDKHDARYHGDRPMLDDRCPACVNTALLLEVEGLKAALSSIERYGLDTMSGPADEVADLAQWIRDGVREMVHRARAALSPASGGV